MGDAEWASAAKAYVDWLVTENKAVVVGCGWNEDGSIFGAFGSDGDDAAWKEVYKDAYQVELEQEDGTKKKVKIQEWDGLKDICNNKRPAAGFWLGGEKWVISGLRQEKCGDHDAVVCVANKKPGKSACVYVLKTMFIVAIADEKKGQAGRTLADSCYQTAQPMIEGKFGE